MLQYKYSTIDTSRHGLFLNLTPEKACTAFQIKNSTSVILTAIISIIIMVAVICTGYKFNTRKMILIPIQKRIKHLFTCHRSLTARK